MVAIGSLRRFGSVRRWHAKDQAETKQDNQQVPQAKSSTWDANSRAKICGYDPQPA
jgi:hypothetical protein